MKVLLISLFLFFCQNFSSTAQNANKDYAKWQHPVLQQLRANAKNIVPFYNKDSTAFVTVSAIDTKQNMIYWFNCYGYYFDAVPINEENKTALLKKTISPFKYYNLITSQYINAVNIGRKKLQANGNNAKFTAYEKQLFQIDDTLKFPSTLTKLIDLDKQFLSVEMQLLQFNGTSPKYIKKDTSYNKTMDIKYGTVQTSYLPDTTSIYYNRIAIAPVYKAIVNHKKASIAYYSRKEELIDELQINKTRLNNLLKEKIDVFLLYRGWLEMQRFYISETITNCKTNLKQNTRTGTEASSKSTTTTKEKSANQSMLKYAYTLLETVDNKIDYATNLDEEFVSQVIREEYEPTIPPEPVVSTMTRGNKKYELTDHRGNVMAVVTDRKIAVSSNGVTVDYYEPDVVSATDYAPFGSALPGRSYSSENYRYGFNGKENDKDISEGGQDYGMRIYDERLGRFLSVDPVSPQYPMLTPYQFASNRPIDGIDLDGKEWSLTSSSIFNGQTLIQKTNEFIIKLTVINQTNLSNADLKIHLEKIKFGAERVLQDKFVTIDKQLEIKNTVKIEYIFDSQNNPDDGFTLVAVNRIPEDINDRISGTITLAKTKEIGNTQNNKITFSIDEEIKVSTGTSRTTIPNTLNRQAKSLAEEILHTGSLGHTGVTFVGDRPDEKDADINMFTPVTDNETNVMVQRGQNGMSSTTNVYQFQKVERQVRKDLGKKVVDKREVSTPQKKKK